ncbi:restriction endonuclease subunit S [Limosilactobacillus reuteri]|uniref:restriction endonuclease subunit S n=1 Tax=Limosilactobacillus reuteri TaxID=1598 RepID=UPI001E3E9AE5|nr:restriction endonuclease subunit S [Limosilactobacillus reuteri]MCC4413436.1 restriction endonuclease subunit S [Limosilactobacillus reuteri]
MIEKTISALADQIRGVSYNKRDLHDKLDENSIILLRANNIVEGKLNFRDVVYVDKNVVSADQYLKDGDILISASSGSKKMVGKAASFHSKDKCTFGAFCKVVRPHDNIKEFLRIYFQSATYRREISHLALGANINNIRNEHINSLQVRVPDYRTRLQIIKVINTLQKIRDVRKQELKKLDELIKARFVEMFGDPRCNNFNWKKSSIKKSCTLKSGKSLSVSIENEGGDIPYIKVKDMNNPKNIPYITTSSKFVKIENVEKQIFPPGTVIFPKRGGAIGTNKKRLTEVTICADLNIMGVIPNAEKLNSQYLFAYFKTIDLKTLNNGSSVPQINNKDIEPLEISLPPLSLQNEYANFVRQVDKSKFENIVYLNKTLSSKILSQIGDVIRD